MILSWILSNLATIVGFLMGALMAAHIMRQQRAPTTTIAWLLAVTLIPYVGVPLYVLLGGRKTLARAGRKPRLRLPDGGVHVHPSPLEDLLRGEGVPPATAGNRLELQITGEASHAALVDLIEGAQESLQISVFILYPDAVGRGILDRLVRRAAEGVSVRLLLDGVGSLTTSRRVLAPLAAAGGRYAFFMPVLRHPLRGRSNLRNHRKTVIADGRRVLGGGANIAQEYMGPAPSAGRWRDLTFTLEGPAVSHYVGLFRSDWSFASEELLAAPPERGAAASSAPGAATVQVVPSGPDVDGDPLYDALLTLAFSAQRRLWIVTPYFVPDEALARAMILAVRRGVDLRIVVPVRSNHWVADLAGRSYLRDIGAEGGVVLDYPRMVHAKAVLVDDITAILGSANLDMRSLLLNYEAGLAVYSAAEISAVEAWMQGLAQEAHVRSRRVGTFGELAEALARLVAPQL